MQSRGQAQLESAQELVSAQTPAPPRLRFEQAALQQRAKAQTLVEVQAQLLELAHVQAQLQAHAQSRAREQTLEQARTLP